MRKDYYYYVTKCRRGRDRPGSHLRFCLRPMASAKAATVAQLACPHPRCKQAKRRRLTQVARVGRVRPRNLWCAAHGRPNRVRLTHTSRLGVLAKGRGVPGRGRPQKALVGPGWGAPRRRHTQVARVGRLRPKHIWCEARGPPNRARLARTSRLGVFAKGRGVPGRGRPQKTLVGPGWGAPRRRPPRWRA